jgi:hypothetical protein
VPAAPHPDASAARVAVPYDPSATARAAAQVAVRSAVPAAAFLQLMPYAPRLKPHLLPHPHPRRMPGLAPQVALNLQPQLLMPKSLAVFAAPSATSAPAGSPAVVVDLGTSKVSCTFRCRSPHAGQQNDSGRCDARNSCSRGSRGQRGTSRTRASCKKGTSPAMSGLH